MHIHVLVVEDNFDLAGTVIDYLEAAGVVCDHARDGQAASTWRAPTATT